MKVSPIPLSLCISLASLILFCSFGAFVNSYSESYERKIEEVRRESNFAEKRLKMAHRQIIDQRRKADSLKVMLEARTNEDVVWLARGIYSETKRTHEMRYVGWVIRNRIESGFRSSGTYRSAVLHPKQFSAFNKGYPLRDYYLRLKPEHVGQVPLWYEALATAKRIIEAPSAYRPIPKDTHYFYSKRSMSGEPHWKKSLYIVDVPEINNNRFVFLKEKNFASVKSNNGR